MKNIAIFASGSGSNFEAIAQACTNGTIPAQIVLLVCDQPGAYVIERAKKYHIRCLIASPEEYPSKTDFEQEIVLELNQLNVNLICLAGYMRIVSNTLLSAYSGRIINIHPSLLPAFKGAHAIEDAVAYGVKVYGITIHYVDETLDGGKIITQKAFNYDGNDPAEVHKIGQKIEHQLYVQTIRELLIRN
ncbi:MAG TPA: phosphoribosylglycinamide formyltransferase [Bacteroidales bacterium]|nr:phosphoribosylglycinamide formyltransferase [Bacteroidales bacterium]